MPDTEQAVELQFAEDMGRFFESGGLSRMAGRVWAMLLVMNSPHLSALELQEALGASAGSISGATRSLLDLGLIERVNVRGERRDYFAPRDGAIANIMRNRRRPPPRRSPRHRPLVPPRAPRAPQPLPRRTPGEPRRSDRGRKHTEERVITPWSSS